MADVNPSRQYIASVTPGTLSRCVDLYGRLAATCMGCRQWFVWEDNLYGRVAVIVCRCMGRYDVSRHTSGQYVVACKSGGCMTQPNATLTAVMVRGSACMGGRWGGGA